MGVILRMFILLAGFPLIIFHPIEAAEPTGGKCWKGNKEDGYSEVMCPTGQFCYSIKCPFYGGGIRYFKGCAVDEDLCLFSAIACVVFPGGVQGTCKTCREKDLCNDEQDEGNPPNIQTTNARRDVFSSPLQCKLQMPPAFGIEPKNQSCDWGQIYCMNINICGAITVMGCSPEYVCSTPLIQEAKQNCEFHGKSFDCDTCYWDDFCNDNSDEVSESGGRSTTDGGGDGRNDTTVGYGSRNNGTTDAKSGKSIDTTASGQGGDMTARGQGGGKSNDAEDRQVGGNNGGADSLLAAWMMRMVVAAELINLYAGFGHL